MLRIKVNTNDLWLQLVEISKPPGLCSGVLGWGDANMQQVLLQRACGVWMGVQAAA